MPLVEEPSAFVAGQSSCELTSIAVSSCSSFSNGSVAVKKRAISDGDDLYNAARNIGTVYLAAVDQSLARAVFGPTSP